METLSFDLISSFTVFKKNGGLKPESFEQLQKALEYLAQNRGEAFKASLKGWMKNYKDHPELWEEMIAILQTEFYTGNSEGPSVALKIITDVAYDKAFEGLSSRTPKTFNDKECFKKMSETISKKFMESISKIKTGHHISIIHTGCEAESNTSITYKFDVSNSLY